MGKFFEKHIMYNITTMYIASRVSSRRQTWPPERAWPVLFQAVFKQLAETPICLDHWLSGNTGKRAMPTVNC